MRLRRSSDFLFLTAPCINFITYVHTYKVAQKTGPPAIFIFIYSYKILKQELKTVKVNREKHSQPSYLIANIPKTPRPNCMKIGGLLQYYMLNTVINFLFKNFIALWPHLAKTPLLSFIHTAQIDLSIAQ